MQFIKKTSNGKSNHLVKFLIKVILAVFVVIISVTKANLVIIPRILLLELVFFINCI